MSVLRRRNRLVYFRVSEDEFQQFNEICDSKGARSISDLARVAMKSMIREANSHQTDRLAEKLNVLDAMIGDISRRVSELSELLARREGGDSQGGVSPKHE